MINLKLSQNRNYVKCKKKSVLFVKPEISVDQSTKIMPKQRHVALVIDCSGSMYGEKIEKTKEAAIKLIKDLREGDSAALVVFHDKAKIFNNFTSDKNKIIKRINQIEPKGSTKYLPALNLALKLFKEQKTNHKENKIIFLSDGLPDDNIDKILEKQKKS